MSSVISPLSPYCTTCAYCDPLDRLEKEPGNYRAACFMPTILTCQVYQQLLDRGWTRSGNFCYKPDLKRACCPQYTIRLDALAFKPTKSQRKLVNRFNRWVMHDDQLAERKGQTSKARDETGFVLEDAIHRAEHNMCLEGKAERRHMFEVTLEPPLFTEEKFALFQKYQQDVHNEQEDCPRFFSNFLVDSPLQEDPIRYPLTSTIAAHLPRHYGTYHQMYRIDGALVAMSVLDILPNCVCSAYFIYNSQWERFSLGKLSVFREVALAKEMHAAGVVDIQWLYMGYYVRSCAKSRYKGEYAPSYLADPEEHSWHRLEDCIPLLANNRYACFAHPERSIKGEYQEPLISSNVPEDLLAKAYYIEKDSRTQQLVAAPITTLPEYQASPMLQRAVLTTLEALGDRLVSDIYFDKAMVNSVINFYMACAAQDNIQLLQ